MVKRPGERTRDRTQQDEREAVVDLGLGALFKGLGALVDIVGELAAAGEEQRTRTGEFRLRGLGEKGHGVYGLSVRVGIGGTPQVQRFGNIRPTGEGPEVADVREPLVDVFDEEREIVVVVEVPGVDEEEVTVEVRDDVLTIETRGKFRYAKELLLPHRVDPGSLKKVFKNGLLELRLDKG